MSPWKPGPRLPSSSMGQEATRLSCHSRGVAGRRRAQHDGRAELLTFQAQAAFIQVCTRNCRTSSATRTAWLGAAQRSMMDMQSRRPSELRLLSSNFIQVCTRNCQVCTRSCRTSAATRAAWLGAMQRSVMDMRGCDTGGMQCCATSAPLPFSTRHDPAGHNIMFMTHSRQVGRTDGRKRCHASTRHAH